MFRLVFLLSLCFFLAPSVDSQTVVRGKVLGANGKPMQGANISVARPNETASVVTVSANENGEFKLMIRSSGIWMLRFAGVFHQEYVIALCIDKSKELKIDVRLKTYEYPENIGDVKVTGNFNLWYPPDAVLMHKENDGMYTTNVNSTSDSVVYRLIGVRKKGDVEGTLADAYQYNGSGGYNTILSGKKGQVRIVFDPKKLPRSSEPSSFVFASSDSVESRFAAVCDQLQKFKEAWAAHQIAFVSKKPQDLGAFDWPKTVASVAAAIKTETNELTLQALYLSRIQMELLIGKVDSSLGRSTVAYIPAGSIVWQLAPGLISVALDYLNYNDNDAARDRYVQNVLDDNPVTKTKTTLLVNEFKRKLYSEQKDKAMRYFDILISQYGETSEARQIQKEYSPMSAVQIGRSVPQFSVRSLEDTTQTYSNATLRGKYSLINFWASSNNSSVSEVKNLSNVYEKYRRRSFTILSLSMDGIPQNVVRFRKGKWKMPWLHAFVERGFDSKICKSFEAYSLPKNFLVDSTGKVIALGKDLHGDQLEATLGKYLGK
jgi:peroxiredoxin